MSTTKSSIKRVLSKVSNFLFEETKLKHSKEIKVDHLLLLKKTNKINKITNSICLLTWEDTITDKELKLISDIHATASMLRAVLLRNYLREDEVDKNRLKKDLWFSIFELNESIDDMMETFFVFPAMDGFGELTEELQEL